MCIYIKLKKIYIYNLIALQEFTTTLYPSHSVIVKLLLLDSLVDQHPRAQCALQVYTVHMQDLPQACATKATRVTDVSFFCCGCTNSSHCKKEA